jgi:hypothetical protein
MERSTDKLVVIEVEGGVVNRVFTDADIHVVLVDWDGIKHGDDVVLFPCDGLQQLSSNYVWKQVKRLLRRRSRLIKAREGK